MFTSASSQVPRNHENVGRAQHRLHTRISKGVLEMDVVDVYSYRSDIEEIGRLNWEALDPAELTSVAWAYYHFSIQFRENLEIACDLYPEDDKLSHLKTEECDTSNLSPCPGVAEPGERMNHDEFMRRLLLLSPISDSRRAMLEAEGARYLAAVRPLDEIAKAMSIASYEDGGLECVFRAILRAPNWDGPLLQAFKHFLSEHIRFDSDPEQGHGALSRHMRPDDRVLPFWTSFRQMLVASAPRLAI